MSIYREHSPAEERFEDKLLSYKQARVRSTEFNPPVENDGRCYICNLFGHKARNCYYNKEKQIKPFKQPHQDRSVANIIDITKKVTRCFRCRKLGHMAKDCPMPEQTDQKEVPIDQIDPKTLDQVLESFEEEEWDFLKNTEKEMSEAAYQGQLEAEDIGRGGMYRKIVQIGQLQLGGYIDTCSSKCLIKFSIAQRAKLNVQLTDSNLKIRTSVYKLCLPTIGKTVTSLTIDGVTVHDLELYIVNDNALWVDVVIGRTWLNQHHVAMIKLEDSVYIGHVKEHPFKKVRSALKKFKAGIGHQTKVEPEDYNRFDPITSSDDEKNGHNVKVATIGQEQDSRWNDGHSDYPFYDKFQRKSRSFSRDRDMRGQRHTSRESGEFKQRGKFVQERSGPRPLERPLELLGQESALDRSNERIRNRSIEPFGGSRDRQIELNSRPFMGERDKSVDRPKGPSGDRSSGRPSFDRRGRSPMRRGRPIGGRGGLIERRGRSIERRGRSGERRGRSIERKDRSIERRSSSIGRRAFERRSRSIERRGRSGERGNRGTRRSRSMERSQARPSDRLRGSFERFDGRPRERYDRPHYRH